MFITYGTIMSNRRLMHLYTYYLILHLQMKLRKNKQTKITSGTQYKPLSELISKYISTDPIILFYSFLKTDVQILLNVYRVSYLCMSITAFI